MTTKTRHILSLSGGKDSAALAIYMRDKVPEMEYIFHDTEKELPETYEYLARLEAILGKKIQITTPDVNFDHWLAVFGGMIPSKQRRWCTKYLKLKPFEKFVGDDNVVNYIGIRADEERAGYISHKSNITPSYPFRENGLVLKDIINILNDSGLGLPTFTKWGRTRSGCYFCFFQQKIEWVRLKETYPDLFEKAKKYEYANQLNGNPFYWNGNEPLEELEKPERMEEIKINWERAKGRESIYNKSNRLIDILGEQRDKEIIANK
jgi:3'-phosphoadenosine 5'-phosphosulfate sulfotransferase (PAPS reductase)/FAD synthetase